jgi:hypothetical protein
MMRRVPIDSAAPVVVFALARLVVSIAALTAVAIVGFPYHGRAGLVLAVFVLWSVAVLATARRNPERALHPAVPAIDFALLLALELVAPDTLLGVQFAALFLIAAHAHFQGERRGVMIAALGAGALIAGAAIRGDAPVDTDLLIFYEVVFFLSALATSVVVGLLRTSSRRPRPAGGGARCWRGVGAERTMGGSGAEGECAGGAGAWARVYSQDRPARPGDERALT